MVSELAETSWPEEGSPGKPMQTALTNVLNSCAYRRQKVSVSGVYSQVKTNRRRGDHTREYYTATKRKEIETHAST